MTLTSTQNSAATPKSTGGVDLKQVEAKLNILRKLPNSPILEVIHEELPDAESRIVISLKVPDELKTSTPDIGHEIYCSFSENKPPVITTKNIHADSLKASNERLETEYDQGGVLLTVDYLVEMTYGAQNDETYAFRQTISTMSVACGLEPTLKEEATIDTKPDEQLTH